MIDFFVPATASQQPVLPETAAFLASTHWCLSMPGGLYLTLVEGALALADGAKPKQKPVMVDFMANAMLKRQRSGGHGELIAKAVGIKHPSLTVLDATAGLGRDAFVLASMGVVVGMLERHPVVRALLADGLARAYFQEPSLSERLRLLTGDLLAESAWPEPSLPEVAVVYLDPMFPARSKKAAVKKEMAMFHQLVGPDEDSDQLLTSALALAQKRVVVKRPKLAPYLGALEPQYSLKGQSCRFDVYLVK